MKVYLTFEIEVEWMTTQARARSCGGDDAVSQPEPEPEAGEFPLGSAANVDCLSIPSHKTRPPEPTHPSDLRSLSTSLSLDDANPLLSLSMSDV
jgi:hypothetical protein